MIIWLMPCGPHFGPAVLFNCPSYSHVKVFWRVLVTKNLKETKINLTVRSPFIWHSQFFEQHSGQYLSAIKLNTFHSFRAFNASKVQSWRLDVSISLGNVYLLIFFYFTARFLVLEGMLNYHWHPSSGVKSLVLLLAASVDLLWPSSWHHG